MVLDPLSVMDIEIALEETYPPSSQAPDALIVCLDPLQCLMVCDDCVTLELYIRTKDQICPYHGKALSFCRIVAALCGLK